MFSAVAVLIGLLGLGQPGQIEAKQFNIQGWQVTVSRDRFTGSVTCRATDRGMGLSSDAIVFKFGRHVDTSKAFYRLDLGPAYAVADQPVNQELRHIVEIDAPLENPSAGAVALPVALLAGVTRVDIRPNALSPSQSFDVKSVPAVLQFEREHACFTDADLQRPNLTAAPTGAKTQQ
jgi:hypothetical protein